MPYIFKHDRDKLDSEIEALVSALRRVCWEDRENPHAFAGPLNYVVTRLIIGIIPDRRYWVFALVAGVLTNIKDEFYRRVVVDYEDKKKDSEGDVY